MANEAAIGPSISIATVQSPVGLAPLSSVGTIGSIQFLPNMADVGTIGTVISPLAMVGTITGTIPYVESIGTIGTILAKVAIMGPIAISTINNPSNVAYSGTLATIQSPVAIANVADVGTLGTIVSGNLTETSTPVTPTLATTSATIIGASGTLYGVLIANPLLAGGLAGTVVLLFNSPQTQMYFIAPAGDIRGFMLPNGISFTGSLVASLIGTLSVSVMH